nr:uncharacterized protein LOC116426171 [Nomia melanderi]
MQAAEMLCGTRVYHLVFLISLAIGYVHSYPLQILPSIPGYIPVYIRHGDQPLEEINPALAEAFHEEPNLLKATNLANVNGPTDISLEEEEANKNNVEAIRVRKAENNFPAEDEKSKEPTKKAAKEEPLKLEATANTVKKVVPVTKEQKDFPKKAQIEIKEQAEKHGFKLSLPELSSEQLSKEDNPPTHNSVVKADQVIVDRLTEPNPPLIKDISQSSTKEDIPVITIVDEKLPTKELPLPSVLSNVQKMTAPPETLHQLEMERTENQFLEEKSK